MCVLCQRATAEHLALQGDLSTGSTALALSDAVLHQEDIRSIVNRLDAIIDLDFPLCG